MNHQPPVWSRKRVKDLEIWTGETAAMRISLIPSIGSKMISLYNLETGREWLTQSEDYNAPGYGRPFTESSGSGWDEMFPTITPCRYPGAPWPEVELPDHGEVWSIPWQAKVDAEGQRLHCEIRGVRLPYLLSKTYVFPAPDRLRIGYAVKNLSPAPMVFLWAAHPLFRIEEGMEIRVPQGLNEIVVSYTADNRLGRTGEVRGWPQPLADRPDIRLDRTGTPEQGTAEKYYFAGPLPSGRAGIYDPAKGDGLELVFPVDKVPYLSVWANDGGFEGQYHLALEPATGFLDDLSYARKHGQAAEVGPDRVYEWFLEVSWI
ncbi:hypothetical protein AWM70_06855 [Paenibacillus yonginensis]|uniref:Galactose mutarotase n=1 Tax=Paenibacillus yonginensis TaxID=1462996 RepID=A0A1B1MYV1_9BACL|nr:hypothetical protein [Paenibacillus yonginensis]ANS74336.1 hypothetical protein AWM70_06855 [Paenibacillus yonginensis]